MSSAPHNLEYAERFELYFESLGSQHFAGEMAKLPLFDESFGRHLVLNVISDAEVLAAASFHGDIGQKKATLDKHAVKEQGAAFANAASEDEAEKLRQTLLSEGEAYKARHGIKFLVSAAGKSATEMLEILRSRMDNAVETEWRNARNAIWEIAMKRLRQHPFFATGTLLATLHHQPRACAIAVCNGRGISKQCYGECNESSFFEMASLSKMIGTAFAMEYFAKRGIPMETKVNELLARIGDLYRVPVADGCPAEWAEQLTLMHLVSHLGLNMHYVCGVPANEKMATMSDYLRGFKHNVESVKIINEPGTKFKYSGAGFIVLQYIIEQMEGGRPIAALTKEFIHACGASEFTMEVENVPGIDFVTGYDDRGAVVPGTRKMFPAFAAGGSGTPAGMLAFLQTLYAAYVNLDGAGPISHDTARRMLYGVDRDITFMGCKMGVGVFVLEGGSNKFMLHQGANDGFRVLNLLCFDGPDAGKGFVTVTTGDVSGVHVNAEIAQKLIVALNISQCDTTKFHSEFNEKGLKQEDIVNKGYRELVFRAFANQRPEPIVVRGPKDPLAPFNVLVNGTARFVSNERFARIENLFSDHLPFWDPELFGAMGKVMDSWETERHNFKGVDEAIIDIAAAEPQQVRYIFLSTMYHTGNQSPFVAVHVESLEKPGEWITLVPKIAMGGHSFRHIDLGALSTPFKTVKVQMFPDGGFTRLGMYTDVPADVKGLFVPLAVSVCTKHTEVVTATKKPLSISYDPTPEIIAENVSRLVKGELYDCANQAYGGTFVSASNEHYGKASNTINPFPPLSMFDGLESARSRRPNSFEEMVIKLRKPSQLRRIVVDFTYFVNNSPVEMEILGKLNDGDDWVPLMTRRYVKHYAAGKMAFDVPGDAPMVHFLRAKAFPCGGFNRLHAFAVFDN